jgi:exonuclease VII small subunit
MTDHLEQRVSRLEQEQDNLGKALSTLNTTLALLNQSVEAMSSNEEKKQQLLDKGLLFVVAGFIAAFVAWIVRGGLST